MKTNSTVALVALLFVVGCATFEQNSSKAIVSVSTMVEAARKSWVAYVTQQRILIPDPAKRQDLEQKVAKVGDVYAKYQNSMRAANAALTSYHNAPIDQTSLKTALAALSDASGELVALINSFITTQ